jgi:hypothetical protein
VELRLLQQKRYDFNLCTPRESPFIRYVFRILSLGRYYNDKGIRLFNLFVDFLTPILTTPDVGIGKSRQASVGEFVFANLCKVAVFMAVRNEDVTHIF